MLREERFKNIIEFLKVNSTIKIDEILELNKVSADTARRDLEILESYGALKRVRGGAVLNSENMERQAYDMRINTHREEKASLARLTAKVVEEGQTIALGSGTTTVAIARFIAVNYNRLIVITNDMDIVKILSQKEGFSIIVLGGLFDPEENATYGEQCEKELERFNADVGIISVSSISAEKGLSDFRLEQNDVFRKIIEISKKVVAAVDSSKFERTACETICSIDEVDIILSDGNMTEEQKRLYMKKGLEVIITEEN